MNKAKTRCCLPYRKLYTKGMSASWRTTMSAASGTWQAQEAWTCLFHQLVWLFLLQIRWPWTLLASKLLKFLVAMTWMRVGRNRASAYTRNLNMLFLTIMPSTLPPQRNLTKVPLHCFIILCQRYSFYGEIKKNVRL